MATSISFDIFARDRASDTIDRVGDSADKTGSRMSKFSALGVAAGAAVGAAVIKFGSDSVAAYKEAEVSTAQLQAAFSKFPKLADTNIGALQRLNTQLAAKTKYDDDATASGQAVLASFKLTGTQITELTPLLQDYATRTGKTLPDAAQDLGKAMLGQGRSLKAVGIDFKDTGTAGGNFDQVMAGLRTQVGGFAEKEGKTAAGQSAILTNRFGEVQEKVGAKLVPALTTLGGVLLQTIGFLENNTDVLKAGAVVLGVVAGAWAVASAATLANTVASGLSTAATTAQAVASRALAVGHGIVTAAQWAWNAALTANPIGLVVVAIAALVGALVLAYRHSETFREIVDGAFAAARRGAEVMWASVQVVARSFMDGLRDMGEAGRWLWDNALRPAFAAIVGAWLTVVGAIVNGAADAFGWMPGIGPKLRAAAERFNDFRETVNSALNQIDRNVGVAVSTSGSTNAAEQARRVANAVNSIDRNVVVRITATSSVNAAERALGFRASGGPVSAGMPYVVGEKRAELFIPDTDGVILPSVPSMSGRLARSAGGGSAAPVVNVYVTGVVGNHADVAKALAPAVREEFAGMARKGATLGFS